MASSAVSGRGAVWSRNPPGKAVADWLRACVTLTAPAGSGSIDWMAGQGRTLTMLLRDWRSGNQSALDELMPLVYSELHKIAASYMRGERVGHTMRPTDLVGEAYLRLADGTKPEWNDRVHFFAIAARTMRQILVDHARKHHAEKRGSGDRPVTLDEGIGGIDPGRPDEVLALDEALQALAKFDERKERAIELHYFGGLTQEEIATSLDVHVNTVARDLKLAEAWLHRYLRDES